MQRAAGYASQGLKVGVPGMTRYDTNGAGVGGKRCDRHGGEPQRAAHHIPCAAHLQP